MTDVLSDRTTDRLVELLAHAAVHVARVAPTAHRLATEWEGPGYGNGRTYDAIGSPGSVIWCDVHGREVERCHRWCPDHDRDIHQCDGCAGSPCVGAPLFGPSDPTGNAAFTGDTSRADLARVEQNATNAIRALLRCYRQVAGYATGDLTPTEHEHRPSTGGDCEACDRYVPGTASDRLRAGFCLACTKSWSRHSDRFRTTHPQGPRQAFIRWRRDEVSKRTPPAHHDPKVVRTFSWTHHGVEYPAQVLAVWVAVTSW